MSVAVLPTHPAAAPVPDRSSAGRDSLVVIPTYEEAENIGRLIPRVLAAGPFDVLVVDDNSPDGTGYIADDLASRYRPRVTVIHRPGKLGIGSAYVAGFRFALERGYERVFEMDADFSHAPGSLPALRAALEHADVVLGSRHVPGGGSPGWALWRRALSRGGSAYAACMLGLPFGDLTSGFKGFRRRALERLDLGAIQANGYCFQIEVTYRCRQAGARIVEVPIQFELRRAGHSKLSGSIVAEALLLIWRLRSQPSGSAEAPT
jgi:dolichol-phosphate mannosyltransferase